MKKFICLIVLILSTSFVYADLVKEVTVTNNVSASGAVEAVTISNYSKLKDVKYHLFSWQLVGGTLSACSIKAQKSSNNTWVDITDSYPCTSAGAAVLVEAQTPTLRAYVSTWAVASGSPYLSVNYSGYRENVEINLYAQSAFWGFATSNVAVMYSNPVLTAPIPGFGYCLTSLSVYNSSDTASFIGLYETEASPARITLKSIYGAPSKVSNSLSFPTPMCFGVNKGIAIGQEVTAATVYVSVGYVTTVNVPVSTTTTTLP